MIVKNESHIIESTLKNVTDKMPIDYWVISDTGSTDNTKEIINKYAFSAPSDYIFIHDADDRIEGDFYTDGVKGLGNLDKLLGKNPDAMRIAPTQFSLRIGKDFTYNRPFIFHNAFKWCFRGVLHEYADLLDKSDGPVYTCVITSTGTGVENSGVSTYYIDSRREGSRSKDPEKYLKDAMVLEKAYLQEKERRGADGKTPEDSLEARYAFYCAQSYKDSANLPDGGKYIAKSIEYYLIRTKLGGYQEEVYLSYLYAARCMMAIDESQMSPAQVLGKDADIEKLLLAGWESMRDRSECLYYLAFYFRQKKQFVKAYMYASLGVKIKFPMNRFLFLEKDIYDRKIIDECAISSFYTGRHEECYALNQKILKRINPATLIDSRLIENMKFCVQSMREKAIGFSKFNFTKPKERYYGLTLTMTTCKRYDLFTQTVNSLLNNVKDLYMIERFICVDDNSSHEDRVKMLDNYPFFEFVFKKPHQKGHVESMNILRGKLTDADRFIFHLEDDFVFLRKRNYIAKSIRVLKDNPKIGQVLFNRNYAETPEQYNIQGGDGFGGRNGVPGVPFLIHEYVPEKEKRKYSVSCEYWPHYSFRPGITKKEVWDKVGKFNTVPHFEMEYAFRYVNAGYVTAFHNRVDLLHIGKLTNEKGDNAYSLNEVKQF